MDILNVASSTATQQSKAVLADQKLSDDFDNFLTLLTTQLQNQDPLEPMDSNQFTEQLVQFTEVEQSIATNKNLEQILTSYQAGQTAASVGYLGKTIVAEGVQNQLTDQGATWRYELTGLAESVGIVVTNENGKVVYAGSGAATGGTNEFNWDGKDNAGNSLPPGNYSASITAIKPFNEDVSIKTYVVGTVDGVRSDGGVPVLQIGKAEFDLNSVLRIEDRQTKKSTTEDPTTSNNS